MSSIQITCETENANIYYTLNGENPTSNSTLYSSPVEVNETCTVKAIGVKEGYLESDINQLFLDIKDLNNVEIPYTLPDNTTIFYDRGTSYGDYELRNNQIVRLTSGEDDQTVTSQNWRFLIGYPNDDWVKEVGGTTGVLPWGPEEDTTGLTDTSIGAGLPNTNKLIELYGNNNSYIWFYVKKFRELTNKNWFAFSVGEWSALPGTGSYPDWGPSYITEGGGNSAWSSNEYSLFSDEAIYLRAYMKMYFNNHKSMYYDETYLPCSTFLLYRI